MSESRSRERRFLGWARFTQRPEFKLWIVEQLTFGVSLAGLAMGDQVNANQTRHRVGCIVGAVSRPRRQRASGQ